MPDEGPAGAPGTAPGAADEDDAALARRAVADGMVRYFDDRRARIDGFVDRHFSLAGSARLHRAALGWDIARAPLNLVLAGPQLGLQLAGRAARGLGAERAGRAMQARHLMLRTRLAARIEWLVATDLLELPYRQGDAASSRDALAETILAGPAVAARLEAPLRAIGQAGADPAFRARLERALGAYAETRAAASEITTGLMTLGAGAVTLGKLTPGVATLGPALATMIAQQAAVAGFPLGAGLGGLWYGAFPAAPALGLVAGLTGGLMLAATGLAAFSGMVTDPLQRRLGLHRRRLRRMVDALEQQMADPSAPAYAARDQYVARLMDVFDLVGVGWRLVR